MSVITRCICVAIVWLLASEIRSFATPIPSDSDVWEGASIVSSSYSPYPGFDLRDIFGGGYSVNPWGEHPGWAIFENGHPPGTVFTIVWRTDAPVAFNTFNLFATGDIYSNHGISANPDRRSISHFVLKAGGQTVYDGEVAQPAGTWLGLAVHLDRTFVAQDFSAGFTQAGPEGPRIIELDGLHSPEPGTAGLLLAGALALFCARRHR